MTAPDTSELRRSCYLLFTTIAVAIAAAKIVGVEGVTEPSRFEPPTSKSYGADRANPPYSKWPTTRPEPTPIFGSNDRSRWATVRSLVDDGTYVIGKRDLPHATSGYTDSGIITLNDYGTIDKVMNPETGEFYSSKPPLFTTLVAGEYWLLKKLFGWSIDRDRWWVIGTILLTVNLLPFALYLVLLARLIEDYGTTDFGRVFTFAAAAVGTFLITFSNTLNNHSPGAFCVLFAIYPLLRKRADAVEPGPAGFFLSGLFAGFATTLELPAASFLAGLAVPLLITRPRQTLLYFVPGALLPLAALFACNYAAFGRLTLAYSEFGGPWYNYAGSHWSKKGTPLARGIDFADEPKWLYGFHLLFGHHGWFSLTPVWLLGVVGLAGLARRSGSNIKAALVEKWNGPWPWTLPMVGALTATLSVVLIAFFIVKTNNYGGNTSGPRWLFWLTPLWLLGTLSMADRFSRCGRGRSIAAMLLGLSVLSVFYPAWNPWRPPWIQVLCERFGWVQY